MMNIITCEKGWESLYLPVVKSILAYDMMCDTPLKKIGVKAVKSENGMLKILTYNPNNAPKNIRLDMIDASTKSLNVCEFCGNTEHVGYSYDKVMKTCCKDCFDTKVKIKYPKSLWYKRNKK